LTDGGKNAVVSVPRVKGKDINCMPNSPRIDDYSIFATVNQEHWPHNQVAWASSEATSRKHKPKGSAKKI